MIPSYEAESNKSTAAKRPLKLITSLLDLSPAISYSPAALLTKTGLRDASASPSRQPSSQNEAGSFSRKIVLNGSRESSHSPAQATRYQSDSAAGVDDLEISPFEGTPENRHSRRRSQTWTSPVETPLAGRSKISNTLSSIQRLGSEIHRPIIARSPSTSCLVETKARLGVLPPPRPQSSASFATQASAKDPSSLSEDPVFNLISASPTSTTSKESSDGSVPTSPGRSGREDFRAIGRAASFAAFPRRPNLHRQNSFASLAEPRLANVEVMSTWSTGSSRLCSAAVDLAATQKRKCPSSALEAPSNPFFEGFRSQSPQRSNSLTKEAVRPSPLRLTHQRHVSAPMVSSSIANFVIPPPLEARPHMQEKIHRRATTSRFRSTQPTRQEMKPQMCPEEPIIPFRRRRTDSTSSCASMKRSDLLEEDGSAESPTRPGRWARGLFSWKGISLIESRAEEEARHEARETACMDQLQSLDIAEDGNESEEETEVFLGLDDI